MQRIEDSRRVALKISACPAEKRVYEVENDESGQMPGEKCAAAQRNKRAPQVGCHSPDDPED